MAHTNGWKEFLFNGIILPLLLVKYLDDLPRLELTYSEDMKVVL